MTGPCRPCVRAPTHSTEATFLPARSAAWASVSACRMLAPSEVRLLKLLSPVRWNVLFVEPCSPGHVPVASVYQPTPVLGGKPWSKPFWPFTPFAMSPAIVGIWPCAAYLSTRSGLMPSEENRTTLFASGAAGACSAAVAAPPMAKAASTPSAVAATSTCTGINRLFIFSPLVDVAPGDSTRMRSKCEDGRL
jgi:hypothetical protein